MGFDADLVLRLLSEMHAVQASDLHLVPGFCPMYRIHGELKPVGDVVIPLDCVIELIHYVAAGDAPKCLGEVSDVDFALALPLPGGKVGRFRVNVFRARGQFGACLRAIPEVIPTLAELGFPVELADRVVGLRSGLVLVTGVTGSGKTTTLAAMIQVINARGGCRIITVEEPIEYVYPAVSDSIVTQREVGRDVAGFYDGLRFGLRQDPDVMLVGEIRDRETAQLALSAAETGHLILATLHTADAKGAITRMVDLFPPEQHGDIRTQLSLSLRCVIAQHLLPAGDGGRRVLATEVLTANFPVRSAIRHGKIETLDSAMQSGRKDGMWSLDADLRRLVQEGRVTIEIAREFAKDPTELGG